MSTVYLVGCGKEKLDARAPARALYTGQLFRKSIALAERLAAEDGARVFILSAEHGAVSPDDALEPYDRALGDLSSARRRAWGVRVAEFLATVYQGCEPLVNGRIVVFAGALYADAVRYGVTEHCRSVPRIETPLEGLGIGQRLAWLTRQLTSR